MKRVSSLLFLLATVFCSLGSAEEIEVTFELHAPDLPKEATVYITGSTAALGNWNPGKVAMTSVGDQKWTHTISSMSSQTLEYKYTLGSWQREGADATGAPLPNLSLTVEKPVTQKDEILFWTEGKKPTFQGQITGTVKYHRQVEGEGIVSRDLIVWLPPGYEESSARYPVLYMHDGQNIVDPKTSSFGVDWQLDETCTRLIEEKVIKPLIIVGIYNTPARSFEYLPGPIGKSYMEFVAKVVKPLIDSNYRTQPERETTFLGGSSAGGICAFMLAWEYPHLFSKAICMSPAFQYQRPDGTLAVDYVKNVKDSERPIEKLFFYIDNGGIGLEKNIQPGVDAMLEALQQKGFQENKDFVWHPAPEARHSEAAWAARFPKAIQLLMNGKVAEKTESP